jgi:hypothetical protein
MDATEASEMPNTEHAEADAPTPSHLWVRRPPADGRARITPQVTLDATGAVVVDPVDLAAFAAAHLAGSAHWLRDDGDALLYVCGTRVVRYGKEMDEMEEPVLEYCDADTRVRMDLSYLSYSFAAGSVVSLDRLTWPRVVRTSPFHVAGDVVPPRLYTRTGRAADAWVPRPLLWRRLVDALEGLVDPSRPGESEAVGLRGIYVAGVFDSFGSRKTWLERVDAASSGAVRPACSGATNDMDSTT